MNEGKALDISDLRIKLDQINEKIISGLKTRSRYSLNSGVFTENFTKNKTWFMYRLKKEQDLDSEFGRFLYNDQSPVIYSKKELAKSIVKAPAKLEGVNPVTLDFSNRIIDNYKKVLVELCEPRENRATYGETTKQDVENILLYNERVIGLGEQIAGYKIQKNPKLLELNDFEKIKKELIVPEREKEVIEKTLLLTEKYGLTKIKAVKEFLLELISITTEAEVQMILYVSKKNF